MASGVNRRLVRFQLRQLLPTNLPVNLEDLSPMTPIGRKRYAQPH